MLEITQDLKTQIPKKTKFQARLHEFLMVSLAAVLSFTFLTFTLMMNSYLMKGDYVKFSFPFMLTLDHLISCFFYSEISLRTFLKGKIQKMPLTKKTYNPQTTLYCTLFLFNVILGNISLRYINVSYMAVIKSSNLLFVAALECFVMKTRFKEKTLATMVMVVIGLVMATVNELSFDLRGFIAAVTAALVSSFQIVIGARLMKTKMDTFNMARLVSVPSMIILSLFILFLELGPFLDWTMTDKCTLTNIFFLFLSGLVAFLLNLSNFWIMKMIMSTTATIIQNLKTVVNIIACVAIFKNEINIKGWIGCFVCILGCLLYGLIEDKTYDKPKPVP